jgi:homoserine kinase
VGDRRRRPPGGGAGGRRRRRRADGAGLSRPGAGPGVAAERDRIRGAHAGARGALVGVAVPATSANLGPGYDSFGVALDVPLVAVAVPPDGRRVVARGHGAGELPEGPDNLVWRGVEAWCAHVGAAVPDVTVVVDSAIPLQRGMGSSSAAAVAGLLLGRALAGGVVAADGLLALAAGLEGHPDNAAAAIHGGLVAVQDDGRVVRATPSPSLRPVLVVPAARQGTAEARAGLPAAVPLATAAANGARAAAVFAALAGLVPLDAALLRDELHEPTRLEAAPTTAAVVGALRAAGTPCALSGSGPAVLAVLPARDDAAVARLAAVVAEAAGGAALEVVPTAWDLAGASACPPAPARGG